MTSATAKHPRVLVDDIKYAGEFVALESFQSNRVVASGKDPAHVMELSKERGVPDPVILFVPELDMALIL